MLCLGVAVAMGRNGNLAMFEPSVGAECILGPFGQNFKQNGNSTGPSLSTQAMIKTREALTITDRPPLRYLLGSWRGNIHQSDRSCLLYSLAADFF